MANSGQAATTFYEGEQMFDVRIRHQKKHRETPEAIGNILFPVLNGYYVPLKEIATIGFILDLHLFIVKATVALQ